MSIKVGQIYKDCYDKIYIITKKHSSIIVSKNKIAYRHNVILQDGEVYDDFTEDEILNSLKLIAEYPTWQEAVNSVEFKGDEKNAE